MKKQVKQKSKGMPKRTKIENENYIISFFTIAEKVKPEFLSKKIKKHPNFIVVEIYKDKKYGAVAKIFERNSSFDRFQENTTKAERKRLHDSLSKITEHSKPVDTSKWVKPDEESMRNELICDLFRCIILKEDYWGHNEAHYRAETLYSILHSHSPKNPQLLTNFSFGQNEDNYFEAIMHELKALEVIKHDKEFYAWCDKGSPKRTEKDWDKRRTDRKKWKQECIKGMVISDQNPPKFKELCSKKYMKDLRKKLKKEKEAEIEKAVNKLKEDGIFGMSYDKFEKLLDSPGIKSFVKLCRERFELAEEIRK